MTKSIEVSGKTEEEALALALAQLGLDRDDVSVEIVERAKSGFLGIGSSPAKIKVTYEADEEKITDIPDSTPVAVAPEKENLSPAPEEESNPSEIGDAAQLAEAFLKGLLAHMGSNASPVLDIKDESIINVNLTGENLGALIGRRGETLDAIQHLANYAVNRSGGKRVRISVDAENYRKKREDSLCRLAEKVAGKVVKYRKNITLEPMNSYERHVIHTALQEFKGVTTYSMDTEPNRRVVVAYDRNTAPKNSGSNGGRRNDNKPSVKSTPNSYNNKPNTSSPSSSTNVREWC